MKTNKIIYWTTTTIISAMMLFSAYAYFTNPQVSEGFKQLGFPDYFRIELGVAKLLAALVLLIPQIPVRVKEWAYAGLGITFISASIAHIVNGDATGKIVTPLVMLMIMAVSNIYQYKISKAKA